MTLYDMTHILSTVDLVAIGVDTLTIDSGCSLEKEFIELMMVFEVDNFMKF